MTTDQVTQVMFFILSAVVLAGAIGVVAARTVFVSALWLILSFLGVAGLYALLGAGFLAAVQVLIYVGAISVLILFAVMLTHGGMVVAERPNTQWALGVIVALTLCGLLAVVGYNAGWPLSHAEIAPPAGAAVAQDVAAALPGAVAHETAEGAPAYAIPGQVTMIGRALMHEHFLSFEVISMILLVALVGAIVVARE